MAIILEISRPFCPRPFYKNTGYSYNVGWLYFAIRFIPNLERTNKRPNTQPPAAVATSGDDVDV